MPARVLLIAPPGSYRVHAYLEAARDLDVDMLVASEGEHSLVPGLSGGIRVDLADTAAVVERAVSAHHERPIAAVVATDGPPPSRSPIAPLPPWASRTTHRPPRESPAARISPAPHSRRRGFRSRRHGGWTCAVPLALSSPVSISPAW